MTLLNIQPRTRLRGGLEQAALPLPPEVADDWRGGIDVPVVYTDLDHSFMWPTGCIPDDVTMDDKPRSDSGMETVTFKPFVVGGTAKCGPLDRSAVGDVTKQMARMQLEKHRWPQVASMLFTGDDGRGERINPTLGDEPWVTYQPAGMDVENPNEIIPTIAGMLETACLCVDGDSAFYVPLGYMPYFVKELDLRWDEQQGLYFYGDIPFVFDCSIPNQTVGGVEADPDDGTVVWVKLGPRPYVAFAPEQELDVRVVRQNERWVVAEQPAIVVFNAYCVVDALVRVAP